MLKQSVDARSVGRAIRKGLVMDAADVDFELLSESVAEVQEHLDELERDLHQLAQYPDSIDRLASAFRHMHSIKGDFAYCHATPIAEYVHALESVLQSMRSRQFQCSPLVCEALLQGMDQIHGMHQALLQTRQYDDVPRATLIGLIAQLGQTRNQADADQLARHVLLALHGEWHAQEPGEAPAVVAAPDSIERALTQGRLLAAALVQRRPEWRDRAGLQLRLVLALNRQYRYPANADALQIAVYWHDVGLLAAADAALQHHPLQKAEDWSDYAAHPELAASWLLSIAPDCCEAAQIVRQHHAWANGKGIVAPGYAHPPHPGSQLLACADLWFERIKGLSGEDYRRGMLRALFDINGLLDSQFDALLINAFAAVAADFQPRA